jgi:hypothetical protein
MRPLGSCDWAFDRHMVDLAVLFSLLPLILEVQVGASGDWVEGSEGWEVVALLRRIWVLCWWRW